MKRAIFALLSFFLLAAGCGRDERDDPKQEEPPSCTQMDVAGLYFLTMTKIYDNCNAENENEFYGFFAKFEQVAYDEESCAAILNFDNDSFSFYGLLTPPIPPDATSEFISKGDTLTPEIKSFMYLGEFASLDGDANRAEFHGAVLVADIDPALCTESEARKTYLLLGTRPPENEE